MSRATVVVRPGWNEAAHIDAEFLHAVAYYEFKTHVEGLLQRGLISQVIRLWSSVCQIDNFPPPLWEWRDFPFSDSHPEWKRTVGDALSIWEDSGFLGLVHGTVQLSWICPGVTRGWSGNPTMIAWARRSWICCSLNRCGPSGQRGILRRTTSSAWLPSSSTMPRAWSTSPSCGMSGELGSLRPRDVCLLHGDAEVLCSFRPSTDAPHLGSGCVGGRHGIPPRSLCSASCNRSSALCRDCNGTGAFDKGGTVEVPMGVARQYGLCVCLCIL